MIKTIMSKLQLLGSKPRKENAETFYTTSTRPIWRKLKPY